MNYLIENHLFSPEFLNRFDGIIAYKPLESGNALTLAKTIVTRIIGEIFELHKVHIQIADSTLEDFIKKGYNPQFGARNLERIMRQQIEDRVAKIILEGKAQPGQVIAI
jgi:ATP-dependent Clp protease ATP-binding subunit ClpA